MINYHPNTINTSTITNAITTSTNTTNNTDKLRV